MKPTNSTAIKYSIVIIHEEVGKGFSEYVQQLADIFSFKNVPFEIIIIANGTEGYVKQELKGLQRPIHELSIYALNKKTYQSVCIRAAMKESCGSIIVVCGSYQQITQGSFKKLIDALDHTTDIISPWRTDRQDPNFNQMQSRVFNLLTRVIAGSTLNDLSCTVKVFRREVIENIDLYGNMYRFMPILASQKGYVNREVKCKHFPQINGRTGFYTLTEYFTRIIDIFTLFFNTRFSRKPLRFFSAIGSLFFAMGFMVLIYIFFQKAFLGIEIGGRPVLLLSILFMVLGIQAASVGLLGEIIAFTYGRQKKEYTIDKEI